MPNESDLVPNTGAGAKGRLLKWAAWLAVIGLALLALLAWLLPPYADYTPRAKISEVLLVMLSTKSQVAEFHLKHGRLPRDAAEASLNTASPSRWVQALSYDGPSGELRAVVQGIPGAEGKVLRLRAQQIDGELKWRCSSNDIPQGLLPRNCR